MFPDPTLAITATRPGLFCSSVLTRIANCAHAAAAAATAAPLLSAARDSARDGRKR